MEVSLRINGSEHVLDVDPRVTLLDLLRERLGLTGSKKGCDHGQCGACTVLAGGRRIVACLALAVSYDGADVVTIEGLERSSSTTRSSAATARRGRSCRRPRTWPRAAPGRRTRSARG